MRLAFLTNHNGSSWGGSEELWAWTAARLGGRGHTVRAAVPPGFAGHPRIGQLREAGVETTVLESVRLGLPARAARRILPTSWQAAPPDPLRLWLERCRHDGFHLLVSLPGFRSNIPRLINCGVGALRYACVCHGYHPTDWIDDASQAVFRSFYEGADFCGFVSEDSLSFVRRALCRDLERARIVHNPFGVDYDHPPGFPAGDDSAMRLAMIGALACGTKGQDLVIDVLAQEKWRARPVTVTCWGDGPNRALLDEWIRRLGLPAVRLAGHTADLAGAWSQAHLGLMASRHEGMPIAMVEGMLSGRAFVATAVGGCRQLVIEGRTGFAAPHADATDLDAALERAWNARGQLQAMGERARQHVRSLIPSDPVGRFAGLLVETASRAGGPT